MNRLMGSELSVEDICARAVESDVGIWSQRAEGHVIAVEGDIGRG